MFESLAAKVVSALPAEIIDQPQPTAPPGLKEPIDLALSWISYVGIAAGIAGLLFVGITLAVNMKRGVGGTEALSGLAWIVLGLAIMSTAAGIVGAVYSATG